MWLYVGTYSTRGSKGIYVYQLDRSTGALTPAGVASGSVQNPSFLALHPSGRFLYAVGECAIGGSDPGGPVAAYAIDPASRIPTFLNQQSSRGGGPCSIFLDHNGRNALVANYGGGSVAVLPIAPDGRLLPASSFIVQHGPLGPIRDRQETAHAHTIRVDPGNRYAVATDLGLDRLFVYRFDAAKGALTPNDPPGVATHPGAGPRHVAFHPTAPYLFAINELNSTLAVYRYDATRGTLTEVQTVPTVAADPAAAGHSNWPAEVRIHPSGRFVYGSNRGRDDIVAYRFDTASGKLRPIGHFPTQGRNPRHFAIDPSGEFLLAANQDSDNVVVFRIDPATGRLSPTGTVVNIPSPVCVCFAPG